MNQLGVASVRGACPGELCRGGDRLAGGGQVRNQRLCWSGPVSWPWRIGSIFQASVRVSFVDLLDGWAWWLAVRAGGPDPCSARHALG